MEKTMVAWLLAAAVSSSPATTPTESVQAAVEQVVTVVQNSDLAKPAVTNQRRTEIRRIVGRLLDFHEMARRCLARHWKERSPKEREEFVRLFTKLLERAYLGKLESYAGERIVYAGETVNGKFATVRSKIVTAEHGEIPIDYQLHLVDSRWVVYDLRVEGVSFVSVYRSQFNRIIRTSSYADLVTKLRLKEAESETLEERSVSVAAPVR